MGSLYDSDEARTIFGILISIGLALSVFLPVFIFDLLSKVLMV